MDAIIGRLRIAVLFVLMGPAFLLDVWLFLWRRLHGRRKLRAVMLTATTGSFVQYAAIPAARAWLESRPAAAAAAATAVSVSEVSGVAYVWQLDGTIPNAIGAMLYGGILCFHAFAVCILQTSAMVVSYPCLSCTLWVGYMITPGMTGTASTGDASW